MALPVGQAAVVEHLQQHVEHVRVRLLDLVEQHDLIGPPPHRFGERAALVVADIARRRADQPRDRVLLHVLRHVDADQRLLVVEQVRRQRLGQFGLADAGRPEEHERADRPVRILQAGARAAHRGRDRLAPPRPGRPRAAELLLHLEQLFLLALEHPVDRHAGPARHHLRDVVGGHRLLDHRAAGALGLDVLELLLQLGDAAIGQFAGALVFAAALRVGEFAAQLVELGLELLRVGQLVLLRLPARGEVGRLLLQRHQLGFEPLQPLLGAGIAFLLQRLLLDLAAARSRGRSSRAPPAWNRPASSAAPRPRRPGRWPCRAGSGRRCSGATASPPRPARRR